MSLLSIAIDILREARARKWFWFLGIGTTGLLTLMAVALRMDVIDGALSGMQLFGKVVNNDIRATDLALKPLFQAVSGLIFYGGAIVFSLASADFASTLLSPGRIEHMLSLPIRRFDILIGTYVGVMILAALGALYGSTGVVIILGIKTGFWAWRLMVAATLGTLCFAVLYAVMITASVFARSSALALISSGTMLLLGIVAGQRRFLGTAFAEGLPRDIFDGLTFVIPRISRLGEVCSDVAGRGVTDIGGPELWALIGGHVLFAGAILALGVWRFQGRDY